MDQHALFSERDTHGLALNYVETTATVLKGVDPTPSSL